MERVVWGIIAFIGITAITLGTAPDRALAGGITPFVGVHGSLTNTNVSCGDCVDLDIDRAKGYGVEVGAQTALADSVNVGLVLAYNNGERGTKVSTNDSEFGTVELGELESSQLALTPQVSVDVGSVSLYARAGVARDWSRFSDSEGADNGTDRLAFTAGGGIEVAVTDHIGLYGQFMHTAANPEFEDGSVDKRTNRASLGARYSF